MTTTPTSTRFRADAPTKPALNVVRFLNAAHYHDERWLLIYHRGAFKQWTGSHWRVLDAETLEAEVYDLFESAYFETVNTRTQQTEVVDYDVNPNRIAAIVHGLQNKTLVDREVNAPVWLDGNVPVDVEPTSPDDGSPMPAREMIACRNGLLHTRSRTFFSHTPRLFNQTAVDFDYDPHASAPSEWLHFLDSLWQNDPDSIALLQEWFGYCLTSRTDLHKMMMLVGPKRAGKGTIIHVLTELLGGSKSVTTTSLASMNQQFGLAHLEDKLLTIMPDVRFRSRDDGVAVERLLSITGEDEVLIDRKHIQAYAARLSTRILLASNELPKMSDESGALKSRLVLLKLTETFLDREDKTLRDRLTKPAVLSGIFNWSLEGLDRLLARGHLLQPKSALEDLEIISHLSSPTLAFVEECCDVGVNQLVSRKQLFAAWQAWCAATDSMTCGDRVFGRNLRAAVPNIGDQRIGPRGSQTRCYRGVSLNEEGLRYISTQAWAESVNIA